MKAEKILEKLEMEYPELRKEPLMEDLRMSLEGDEPEEEEDMFGEEEMPMEGEGEEPAEEDPLAYLDEEDEEEDEEEEEY